MISPDIALHRGAFKLVYLVCLGIVKAQHNVVSLAILVRHQEAVDDCSNGQNVCLHAVLVAQHHRRVGVFLLCLRSSNMKKTKRGRSLDENKRTCTPGMHRCIHRYVLQNNSKDPCGKK